MARSRREARELCESESVGRLQRHAGTRFAMRCGAATHTAGGRDGAWHMRRSGSLRCTVAAVVVVRGPVLATATSPPTVRCRGTTRTSQLSSLHTPLHLSPREVVIDRPTDRCELAVAPMSMSMSISMSTSMCITGSMGLGGPFGAHTDTP